MARELEAAARQAGRLHRSGGSLEDRTRSTGRTYVPVNPTWDVIATAE